MKPPTTTVKEQPIKSIMKIDKKNRQYEVKYGGESYYVERTGDRAKDWATFCFRNKDNALSGYISSCHRTMKGAVDSIIEFHNSEPKHGWLTTTGKFYKVGAAQHYSVIDLIAPESKGDYEALYNMGWIPMRDGRIDTYCCHFDKHPVTKKQYDFIEAFCDKNKLDMPKLK